LFETQEENMDGINFEGIIQEKANAYLQLSDHPIILVLFSISFIICVFFIVFLILAIKKPELILTLFFKSKTVETNECDDCVKTFIKNIQNKLIDIEKKLDKDSVERIDRQKHFDKNYKRIEEQLIDVTITAKKNLIFNSEAGITDIIRAAFACWRLGGDGNSVDQMKIVLLKDHGYKKIWKDELSLEIRNNGKGDKYFQDCIKDVNRSIIDRKSIF